jgi:hypothetical protein
MRTSSCISVPLSLHVNSTSLSSIRETSHHHQKRELLLLNFKTTEYKRNHSNNKIFSELKGAREIFSLILLTLLMMKSRLGEER